MGISEDPGLVRHLCCRGDVVGIRWAGCKGRPTRRVLRVWIERLIPKLCFHSVEIVDNLAVFDREFGDQLFRAIDPRVLHVGETVVTLLYTQHGYVGDGTL